MSSLWQRSSASDNTSKNKATERLIIFTPFPRPGRVKVRLIPALGPEGASNLQCRMTGRLLSEARRLTERRPVSLEVRYEGGSRRMMEAWLGPGIDYRRQGRGDPGRRMERGLRGALKEGVERAVIVGTDSPGVTKDLIESAFEVLKKKELVLGPARDGGYYLIGLRRRVPELFEGIPWGSSTVLDETLRIADGLGLSSQILETLDDVDRPRDLPVWEEARLPDRELFSGTAVSVVIPTLNEASTIGAALERILKEPVGEVIVADGGSVDGTRDIARSFDVSLLDAPTGRGRQMNTGADAAEGEILLFLHSDTRLPPDFPGFIHDALSNPSTVAGAFTLAIDAPGKALRFIERWAYWRSRWRRLPLGDQGLFLRSELFYETGGFPETPLMEDYELSRRLGRRGHIAIIPAPAVTSARRRKTRGVFRTTFLNQLITAAYRLGVSPKRLARWHGGKER